MNKAPVIIIASPTNAALANERFNVLRQEHGGIVTRMCDIYGVGLLSVNYEIMIPDHWSAAPAELDKFLDALVSADWFDPEGNPILTGKTIGVHHRNLKKHCFVKLEENGKVKVLYHTNDRDSDESEFNIAVAMQVEDAAGVGVGFHEIRYHLSAKEQDDVGNLIDLMGMTKFEEGDYEVAIPYVHRNTDPNSLRGTIAPEDTVVFSKVLDGTSVEHLYSQKHLEK